MVQQRWQLVKESDLLTHILTYIDQQEQLLEASDELNAPMWPVTSADNINKDNMLNYHDAVQRLKQTFTQKYLWLDSAINNL